MRTKRHTGFHQPIRISYETRKEQKLVQINIGTDRSIRGKAYQDGRLEIIEDVGITTTHRRTVLRAFTVPTTFIDMLHHVVELWNMILQHTTKCKNVLFLCPGNGAWLVERALKSNNIHPAPVQPVNISRDSESNFQIQETHDRIVVIEDIVETGNTALKLLRKLTTARCPVTLATMLWHDHQAQTDQVLEVFAGYDEVLIPVRIRSDHEKDDVRSLSTLARKHGEPKNHRYSIGREDEFVSAMEMVLDHHSWLHRLGYNLGYRQDEYSIRLHQGKTPSSN